MGKLTVDKFRYWQFNHAIKTSKEIVESGEEIKPLFFAYTEDSFVVFPAMFNNDEEKERFLLQLKIIFAALEISYYIFVHEGWFLKVPKEDENKPFPKPSEHPDKKEALVISCISHDEKRMVIYEIEKEENKRVLKNKIEGSKNESILGAFTELLPPKDMQLSDEFKSKVLNSLKDLGISLEKFKLEN